MTKKIMLSMALLGSTFLMGCSQQSLLKGKDSISATPIQGIEQITQQSDTQFDVVCPTGICRFELTTNTPKTITLSMYYGAEQPFKKLEGIDVFRQPEEAINRLSLYQFDVTLLGGAKPHEIQVIDYFRN
ncbi:hypothetical protein [Enterovibrio norvegicus]|uniref:hypothetical protein n=1 Tax=Enterovibrio norvegicus TaxID=188144 RepID=UPI00352E18D2